MIRVLINTAAVAVCIWAYKTGANPSYSMFCTGWCSAYLLVSIVKSIPHPRGHSSQGS